MSLQSKFFWFTIGFLKFLINLISCTYSLIINEFQTRQELIGVIILRFI